jgi:WD40-like Beta Propeller Repeat
LVGLLGALIVPATAHAAFPGANGNIAFADGADNASEIHTINPDGTGRTQLTSNAVFDGAPAWSPDGTKIAFHRADASCIDGLKIYVMNADGSAQSPLQCGDSPAWSPDGQKIAFAIDNYCDDPPGGIYTMNADGSSPTLVACGSGGVKFWGEPAWSPDGANIAFVGNSPTDIFIAPSTAFHNGPNLTPDGGCCFDQAPNWSPDGQKIAYDSDSGAPTSYLWKMNPDGSGKVRITADAGAELNPAWAPDGSRLVFENGSGGLAIVNAGGTGKAPLTTGLAPDWQPIPINSYARPKGATPLRIALVTANDQCTSPNRTHGAPLAFGSCAPVQLSSGQLTVGTGDANARPALMQASIRLDAAPGDVKVATTLNDIFKKDLSDYTGGLRASIPLQITDKNNTPSPGGPGAATSETLPLEFDIGCTPTADTSAGSDCALNTTLDTLVPGTVIAGKRAVWALGQVKVYDGGADGNPATTGDNTLFAVEGVFVP